MQTSTVDIRYYHDELSALAKEERLELATKNVDSSGI
jgi:hypothetical protein